MSTNVPDFMPVLSAGAHISPAQGACIMEYASFLNGEDWTDLPTCTNTMLARAAQFANDELGNEERQRLLPLLPRLMGTGDRSEGADWAVAAAAAKYVEPILGHENEAAHMLAVETQTAFAAGVSARHVMADAHCALAHAGYGYIEYLSTLIDAYDKATGRTEAATVTADDLRRCAELTGASA